MSRKLLTALALSIYVVLMREITQSEIVEQIAELTGVHASTVWRALADDKRISTATTERVKQYAKQLNYRPNMIARQLAMGRSLSIGLVASGIRSEAARKKLEALHHAISLRKYTLQLSFVYNGIAGEKAAIDDMRYKQVEGVIIITQATSEMNHHLRDLNMDDFPHILFDNEYNLTAVNDSSVGLDRLEVGRMAVSHLVEFEHRNIAYLAPPGVVARKNMKVEGYKMAMQQHNLVSHVLDKPGAQSRYKAGYRVITENIDALRDVTGLIAHCDRIAMGALCALHDLGVSVPEEMSLIGFDNDDVGCVSVPPLTSIAHPIEQLAEMAVDMLFDRINGSQKQMHSSILLKPELVVRQSTALARHGRLSPKVQTSAPFN